MLRRVLVLGVIYFSLSTGYAQQSVNNYKYVIVPNIYDFQNSEDEYQLNSISHFLFNKYGFTAIMQDDEYPKDLQKNGCLALRADVVKDKGLFTTKLHVVLKNCTDQIIFEGQNGESKEKKFKVAYNIALREAFLYVKDLKYSYKPIKPADVIEENESGVVVSSSAAATATIQQTTDTKTESIVKEVQTSTTTSKTLYAQPIDNGYQLVDDTPKVIYVLIFSGKKDFYMVKGKDATVYKLNDNWVIAETVGEDLQVNKLNIKF